MFVKNFMIYFRSNPSECLLNKSFSKGEQHKAANMVNITHSLLHLNRNSAESSGLNIQNIEDEVSFLFKIFKNHFLL